MNELGCTSSIMENDKIIARWETKGNDFLELRRVDLEKVGISYFYRGNGCGGGLPGTIKTDAGAIAWMDNPWGHKDGTGACTVLRSDRPSLKRVSLPIERKWEMAQLDAIGTFLQHLGPGLNRNKH